MVSAAILEYIRDNILSFVNITTTIGYGNLAKSPLHVKNSRKQALYALQKGILSGDNQILGYDNNSDLLENHIIEMNLNSSKLLEAIENLDKKSIEVEINNFFNQIINCQVTTDIMQAILYSFVFTISTIIRKYNGDVARIFSQTDMFELENNKTSSRCMRDWLLVKCNKTCDYIVELQKDKSSNIINQIKNYIDKKYSEDLSIKSIAGVFYLSPAYLGRLFKNNTGEAFSDYLNKVRISKAKKMIISEDSKVYEIIEKVGYNNHEHFYRQFKRYTGISFAEYKESIKKA
jgi:two-component system response regulator YesN